MYVRNILFKSVLWTSDMIDYLVLTSNRQHGHWKIPHVQTNQTKQLHIPQTLRVFN